MDRVQALLPDYSIFLLQPNFPAYRFLHDRPHCCIRAHWISAGYNLSFHFVHLFCNDWSFLYPLFLIRVPFLYDSCCKADYFLKYLYSVRYYGMCILLPLCDLISVRILFPRFRQYFLLPVKFLPACFLAYWILKSSQLSDSAVLYYYWLWKLRLLSALEDWM